MQPSSIDVKIADYPPAVRTRFTEIRHLLHDTAKDCGSQELEESLKWSEPSFKSKQGSPIRISWRADSPDALSVYFNCNTKLVATFREVLPDAFEYHGNRELTLPVTGDFSHTALTQCFSLALQYKQIKHLPLLGA